MTGERGVALVLAILAVAFLSAMGMGLALLVMVDQMASGHWRASVGLLHAADAAIELAARDLALVDDWDLVLSGAEQGSWVDGPAGPRAIPGGGAIDLAVATHRLNCGRTTTCTAAQMNANSEERPWGANNPRWQLFAHAEWSAMMPAAHPGASYLVVWMADDIRETDGNPHADEADEDAPGHGVVRVRAEAYGVKGARRVIQAELARICVPDGSESCRNGVRVQSWQELRHAVP